MQIEARRTNPDFLVYVPPEPTPGVSQVEQHNMHMIVSPLPGGDFLATWTQADTPHGPDQRVVVARSRDRGMTWTKPDVIDEPVAAEGQAESKEDTAASANVLPKLEGDPQLERAIDYILKSAGRPRT